MCVCVCLLCFVEVCVSACCASVLRCSPFPIPRVTADAQSIARSRAPPREPKAAIVAEAVGCDLKYSVPGAIEDRTSMTPYSSSERTPN